jgi:hypothetical protein
MLPGQRFSSVSITDLERYEKPWIEASPYKNRERWDKLILWGCILIGFGIGIALCVLKYLQIPRNQVSRLWAQTLSTILR